MSLASELELSPSDDGSILVAIDGKPRGWDALEWAAAEASSRGCALRILHVFRLSRAFVGAPLDYPIEEWNIDTIETVREILAEAEARARIVAPDIQITVCEHEGTLTDAILREGDRDGLIVLGRGRAGGRIRSTMSVGRRVTRRAKGTVAIITLAPSEARSQSAGRVVVGLDGTESSLDVLGFAFRSARRRGVGLTLIHGSPALDLKAIRLCRETYPDVDLIEKIYSKCSALSLIAESSGAALLVVGGQRRRSHRVAFGLRQRDALARAQSPVAIVKSLRTSSDAATEDFESAAS